MGEAERCQDNWKKFAIIKESRHNETEMFEQGHNTKTTVH